MTLTTNGKNYIAQKFGLSNCYTATGLSWTAVANDGNQVNETGGTASIVGRLVTTSIYASVIINSVTYTYAQLKTANDNTDLTLTDAQWVAANDGTPTSEAQYCYTVTTGSISFASTPSGASITVDSVNLGQITPYTKSGVSAGNHSYLLKLSGYKDYLGTVTVTADQTITVTAQLILDVSMDKITLSDTLNNYTCYGFTVPKDEFSCNTETFKVHAIYSNGYCDVPPTVNQFIWYKWDTVELRFIEYIRTSIFSIGTGYCVTEANLPCNNMYKVTYQTTEKILTIEQQTIQEFGMGMAAVALAGLFILSKMVSKK